MGGLTGETNGSLVENKAEKETVNVQTSKDNIGELLWVKLNEASWWPAQIVDENLVSSVNKPSKGLSSDVLVRKYVDIHSSSAEFKTMIIKNNFNYHEIVKKSLEQDLPSLSSSKSRKRQQSKSKGKVVAEASQNGSSNKSPVSSKKRKQEKTKTAESHSQTPEIKSKNPKPTPELVHHDTDPSTANTATRRPEELSARRVKVMQSLGLVAPSGSPFPRNLGILANP
ncbi:hypothetical protein M8C21_010393, partial [Ambrosia artemisiifolia]